MCITAGARCWRPANQPHSAGVRRCADFRLTEVLLWRRGSTGWLRSARCDGVQWPATSTGHPCVRNKQHWAGIRRHQHGVGSRGPASRISRPVHHTLSV